MDTEGFEVTPNSQVTRRRVISGIAGAGAAMIAGATLVRAQSTPEATDDDSTTDDTEDTISPDDMMASSYQDFLTKLAAELSISDTTSLDTDIRDALKAMVDDVVTAGDLAVNDATDIKTAIDESTSPIGVGFHSGRSFGGFAGPGGMGGPSNGGPGSTSRSGNGKPSTNDETDDTDSTATPTA